MNARNANHTPSSPSRVATEPTAAPFRLSRRERDFGIGYGTSSGYAPANDQRYAQSWARAYFRCV